MNSTRRLIVIDSGFEIASLGSYISDVMNRDMFGQLRSPIRVCSAGDFAEPTSYGVLGELKIDAVKIAKVIAESIDIKLNLDYEELKPKWVDIPDESFQGPF